MRHRLAARTLVRWYQEGRDVVDAVQYAKAEGLEIAVRGGGHNVAGKAVCDDGMMIDLAPMKGIFVDPEKRVAFAQPGLTWSDFNRATQLYGLATTGGVVGTTGIAAMKLLGATATSASSEAT